MTRLFLCGRIHLWTMSPLLLAFSTMLLSLSSTALPLPPFLLRDYFLCARAGSSLVDMQYKTSTEKILRDVRGADWLNQLCVISCSNGLAEMVIYGHVLMLNGSTGCSTVSI